MAKKELQTTFGQFRVGKQIGSGGSGNVYAAAGADGKPVAIKVLSPALATANKRARFKNEINYCSAARHPGILRVLDWGLTTEGEPFYVMPLYSETLRQLMKRKPGAEFLPVFAHLLDGIEAAHLDGVVHRDLKPENIFLDKGTSAVIGDFGIAHFTEDVLIEAVKTHHAERLANFMYSAPEQRSSGRVDLRADIFAIGLMLNEAFTGVVPHGASYPTIAPVAPAYSFLDEVVARAIAHRPEERYVSIGDLRADLKARGERVEELKKLEVLRAFAAPQADWADDLVKKPIQVRDVGFKNDRLIVTLTDKPNVEWVNCFRRVGGSGMTLFVADQWKFDGNSAWAHLPPGYANHAAAGVNQFDGYLVGTANYYAQSLEAQSRKAIAAAEESRKRAIEEETIAQGIREQLRAARQSK